MKKYKSKDGMVEYEYENHSLIYITLQKRPTEPYTIHIPKVINGHKIRAIGDGKSFLCGREILSSTTNIRNLTTRKAHNSLVSIIIDDEIEEIWSCAFGCLNLKELHWPAKCKSVPDACFEDSRIKKLTGMDNISLIGSKAFANTRGLTSFHIPDSCTILDDRAFECSYFTEITGGKNIENVGRSVFENSHIKNITWFPKATVIPAQAFFCCKKLEKITGIEGVTKIDESAFSQCRSLKAFVWPEHCHRIPYACFAGCPELGEFFQAKNGVEDIENAAFSGCSSMRKFNFSSGLRRIGRYAFSHTAIESVDLSDSMIETIEGYAFNKCESLVQFVPNKLCYVDSTALSGTPKA